MRCEWYVVNLSMNVVVNGPYYSKRYAQEQKANYFNHEEDYEIVARMVAEECDK